MGMVGSASCDCGHQLLLLARIMLRWKLDDANVFELKRSG